MASHFNHMEVYSYLCQLTQLPPCIPLPIPTILTRCVGPHEAKKYQSFSLFPTASSNISATMEIYQEFLQRFHRILATLHYHDKESREKLPPTHIPSLETLDEIPFTVEICPVLHEGSVALQNISLEDCFKVLKLISFLTACRSFPQL
jgi:hypothetical protein